jgi:acyl carrier protein
LKSKIIEPIEGIFREVFDDPNLKISEKTHSADVPGWDSLAHMSLVTSIERHFGIRFALGELQDLKNVGEMMALIEKKQ